MHKKTTLFFGFDWVIADTEWFSIDSITYACEKIGISFTKEEYFKHFHGRIFQEGAEKFLRPLKRSKQIEEFSIYKKEYNKQFLKQVTPYEDTLSFIKKAHKKYNLFIVTWSKKSLLEQFMHKYWFKDYFKDIITPQDYSPGKPNPEAYLYTCKKHTIKKQEAIIIEDSPAGHKSAKKANIDMVIVRGSKEYSYNWCIDEVDSFTHLEKLLHPTFSLPND